MKVDNGIFFAAVEEQLAEGRQVTITLVGTSMQPTLCEGDRLTLAPLADEPRVGDVLLFRLAGRHILHRLVAVAPDGALVFRGDNCSATETARRADVVARLVAVEHRHPLRRLALRWLGHRGRRQLRPWYFVGLAVLMWAPLNGVGVPLDNYLLGLRLDHLLHASVYIPCTLFLMDLFRRGTRSRRRVGWLTWLSAVAIGILTESVQYLLPYRGFDINDMVANFLGVSLGWAIILLVKHKYKKRAI